MNKEKRAWIYCRIDAPEDTHGALKGQRQQLMDYAEQMGFIVIGSSEDMESGRSLNRYGVQRFMETAQAGAIDALLVHDISRISRDVCLAMTCLEQLYKAGVTAYSPLEGKLEFTLQKAMRKVLAPEQSL